MATTSRRSLLSSLAALPVVVAGAASSVAATVDADLFAAIARYQDAGAETLRTEDAAQAAYERYYDEFGGEPDFPEALYRTEEDVQRFNFFPVRDQDPETGQGRFPETFVNYLRRVPCRHVLTHRRAATLGDGLPPEDLASGDQVIVRQELVPWPEAQARADEIVAAWDAYQAEDQRRLTASASAQAEEAHEAAMSAYLAARNALALTAARTMQGVVAKAAVVMALYETCPEDFEAEMLDRKVTFNFQLGLSLARDLRNLKDEACSACT